MKTFNVNYIEAIRNNETISAFHNPMSSTNDNGSLNKSYGTMTSTIDPKLFHKLILDLVLPKVQMIEGNKVTKMSTKIIDGFDCYYTTTDTNDILVCFISENLPIIVPIRVLSELKHFNYDSDDQLKADIKLILDKFHDELLMYKNENSIQTNANDAEDELDDIIQIMNDNIDKFLQRQERVSLLVGRTSRLNNNSSNFKRKAERLQERLWWQKMKNWTLLIFTIILFSSALFIFVYIL
ncbi:hypothetical protein KAFR_0B02770 [Kazachstania africana CBS 2517]|uniref:V-SNARE coiled-coil homology domain-containing protein n=1 Tax=Kazachstania africana (strain ATCC 22294 / BCRC 22015 / CBS 2517 / CECT 1963 / NBRC 1671 / NRRL Y-8276) TaxID=1071382 RepID=H2AQC4_KAZAF|nr:hypothetical protein KAFR_0B02770 [Kazachstania africana CBS 2517]CCF56574.1 hypothetical protein KAFR_0B02770 [Kazachstania africana CBS 2517]